jgi:licheninase
MKFIFVLLSLAQAHGADLKAWRLVWSDSFTRAGAPNSAKWKFETGGDGGGNNEAQFYTDRPENARVEGGRLMIEGRKESYQKRDYTSARLISKAAWTYGRFEIRAKLPNGRGLWPAIWFMPLKQTYSDRLWPDNGEIDLMENVGFEPGLVHFSTHTKDKNWMNGNQNTMTTPSPLAGGYHTYILEWLPDHMDFLIDDVKYLSVREDTSNWKVWPFNQDFYLILNLAVGGSWGGEKGIDDTIFPARF